MICINGAAAHLVHEGDLVIIIAYGLMGDEEARRYEPHVVFVDGANRIVDVGDEPGQVPVDSGLERSGLRHARLPLRRVAGLQGGGPRLSP